MKRQIQDFNVGLKAFITKENLLLMVKGSAIDPHWELPGGRVDVGEELFSAEQILMREIREELGPDIQITVGRPITTWSRQLLGSTKYVYLIGFRCNYLSGDIALSEEHTEYRWVTEQESKQLPLASGYNQALDEFWKTR